MPAPGNAAVCRYSPGALDRETLQYLLVGREDLLDDTLAELDRASRSGTPRFFLLVGSRGAGKSHLLSLLYHRVRDELPGRIIPVKLAEEEYSIFRASDFFLRVLEEMGIETSTITALDDDPLVRDAAVDTLAEAAAGRQIAVFADNIHELFNQMDRSEIRALRSVFQRTDLFSMVASAPSLFPGIADHDEPFYNFFRVFHLRGLEIAEAKELMKRVARLDGNTAFIENFSDYEPGIEGLLHFAGGSPRLAVQAYEAVSRAGTRDMAAVFFRMTDEQTPYYREVFGRLPGQRRLIFDTVLSAGTPLTPKDIAERARLNPATVTAQLRRLEADGYVVSRPMRKRTSYEVRDRLFWLWRAMRRPAGRDRVSALIEFLEAWHEREREPREGPYAAGTGALEGDQVQRAQLSLDRAREELLNGNEANGLSLIDEAYGHAEDLDPGTVRRITAGFLKGIIGEGRALVIKSAVRGIVASGGAGFERFLKPVADAVAIVEANDTRLYYSKLQPEERAVVAGIVRAITGSEELAPGL
ncbi:MarR family transcriptional regulator [Methanoculleus sp. FWC-SCC3]|uniref:MarR family transcriptional regulator n=1 Tax=Methanoculleus methanifontis TaxID=2584086 RepID=A0ABT8M580_9EURY|nr:AAA family ATPase [Methanoculleus sp. FWC-SCC3]MDN7013766.1 MarR family transcriptional regulator [Methanoculleus sp. FWC-SCC3]